MIKSAYSYPNSHQYRQLPSFCKFLLREQLEPLVRMQLQISYEADLPLLKQLSQYTDEQLYHVNLGFITEFLQYLSDNKGTELISLAMKRWETDQMKVIGKYEFLTEDITLFNYVRGVSMRKFIPMFSQDIEVIMELTDEIDTFLMSSTTRSASTYIKILKDKITKNEKELLDAQRIANIGSFERNLITNTTVSSPEVFRIFEMDRDADQYDFMEIIHPDDKGLVNKNMEQALKDGSYDYEFRFAKDGKVKQIHAKGLVVYKDQKPEKIIGTIQDITSRKRTEHELLEKTAALERSNESLQQFVYIASHDLKEPVRKISLLTDQVIRKEKNIADSSLSTLTKAHHSSIRMLNMIDDIIKYSTVMHWEQSSFSDLDDIVKEVIDVLEQTILERQATIEFSGLPKANVIRSQFRQLLLNLVTNGLEFSKPGILPQIIITSKWLTPEEVQQRQLSSSNKYLQISVSDNGIGFNRQFSKQIFNLFNRLHNKSDIDGGGMGLAIAKRIVNNHGGTIEASSEEGIGSTFSVTLPQ